jgi:hypothetical protein
VRQRQADGRPTKQYKQGNHADGSNARHGLIDLFCASGIWSVPQPRWRNSHPATRSPTPPLRELAADDIRDRRKYPLTDQDLAAELSTSAVTVKVAKRSASGPDTAGASGPGLAPPPGAARSIRFARAAHRPRVHRSGRLPTTKASLSGQAPTEPGQPYRQHAPTTSRSTHTTCIPPAGPLPGNGVGRSWSDLVDDRWQDLLGRLEAAANEIEEIELPMERRSTP